MCIKLQSTLGRGMTTRADAPQIYIGRRQNEAGGRVLPADNKKDSMGLEPQLATEKKGTA